VLLAQIHLNCIGKEGLHWHIRLPRALHFFRPLTVDLSSHVSDHSPVFILLRLFRLVDHFLVGTAARLPKGWELLRVAHFCVATGAFLGLPWHGHLVLPLAWMSLLILLSHLLLVLITTFSTASAIAIIWPSLLITALIIVIILVLPFRSTAFSASTAALALHHGHAHHHVSAVGAAASRERPATRARLLKRRLDQLWRQLRADGVDQGLNVRGLHILHILTVSYELGLVEEHLGCHSADHTRLTAAAVEIIIVPVVSASVLVATLAAATLVTTAPATLIIGTVTTSIMIVVIGIIATTLSILAIALICSVPLLLLALVTLVAVLAGIIIIIIVIVSCVVV
jgi:hypothetical protein